MGSECRYAKQRRIALKKYGDKIPIPESMFLHKEILENCPSCIKKMPKEKST